MTDPLASRRAALDLITAVLRHHQPLDQAWQAAASGGVLAKCDSRDRAFARRLAATVLRRQGQIDGVLRCLLERPIQDRQAQGQDILRLGAAQILFLDTPAHAAVDGCVSLAAGARAPAVQALKGLVNAVLRRLSREGKALIEKRFASTALNAPQWLWRSWQEAYGDQVATAICDAHMAEPPLDFTLKLGADAARWQGELDAVALPTGSLRRYAGGRIEQLPGFDEGQWWVQDAAAALPAKLLGDVKGRAVLDVCAAPGGKTAQLAAAGARVTALDRSAARLRLVEANLARLGLSARIVTADARAWRPARRTKLLLLDAPCSATGTLRRHPDIARLKKPADIATMVALQDALIDAAVAMLAPGGIMIFCTCSLQPEEGPERIAAALGRHPGLGRLAIRASEIGGTPEMITPAGDLRSLPSQLPDVGGLDGFYAARLMAPE